ncbi:MAG: hypothetical protein R3A79_04710 [Nannocystaceae bacterium]
MRGPWIALSLVFAACSGDDTTTDGSASAASTTADDASTTGDGSDGSSSATGDPEGSASSGESTTDDATTGESTTDAGLDLDEACAAFCATAVACAEGLGYDQCVADCLSSKSFPDASAACTEATLDYLACEAAQDCDDLGEEPCHNLLRTLKGLCAPVQCSGKAEGGPYVCGFQYDCTDGTVLQMMCDGKGCVCLEDGEKTGACDNDICSEEVDVLGLADKAAACCGF